MTPQNLELLKNQVLHCESKDQLGLNDFQKLPDQLGIAIPFVGISRFRLPMIFQHPFGQLSHDVHASLSVNLEQGKTGINMSRLCQILQDESATNVVSATSLHKILLRLRDELRDSPAEPMLKSSTLKLRFSYPDKQPSLRSQNWGWQYYDCVINANQNAQGENNIYLTLNYEYSSVCPCSLSMAKQYEDSFNAGATDEGNGIGVAHGQRSRAKVMVHLSETGINNNYFFEDLIQQLRLAIPTETQSLVKRIDEQAFAIINGSNPMFVEHAAKRISQILNTQVDIKDWIVQIEHFESLHSHNAAAVISKNIAGGLRNTDLFS